MGDNEKCRQPHNAENRPAVPPRSDQSVRSDQSDRSNKSPRHLRPSGGYRTLRSFQAATVVYDATFDFCERFVAKRSRMEDQMVQAARSGRQNIAEGSRDAATSSQTELRLVGVARGSLEELLLDYEDYLRQHALSQWDKDSPEALEVRNIGRQRAKGPSPRSNRTDPTDPTDLSDPSDPSDKTNSPDPTDVIAHAALYAPWLKSADPAIVANALICIIHQANYLLDRQIEALEQQFIQGGGYSEQLAAKRIEARQRQTGRPTAAPVCPQCGKPMALRTARKGRNAGSQFWGCSGYPNCKATRNLDDPNPIDPTDPTDLTDPADPADPSDSPDSPDSPNRPKGSPSC